MIPNNTSVHILVIGGSAYDVRKVVMWSDMDADVVRVQFQGVEHVVPMNRTLFENAKLASLGAGG